MRRYAIIAVIALAGLMVIGGTAQAVVSAGQPGSSPAGQTQRPLQANLLLVPRGLKRVLRQGAALKLTANEPAAGFATITITRALAKRIGIKPRQQAYVVIGRGTLSSVKSGTVQLRLGLPRDVTSKLSKLRHATLIIRLVLVASAGDHVALVATGHY